MTHRRVGSMNIDLSQVLIVSDDVLRVRPAAGVSVAEEAAKAVERAGIVREASRYTSHKAMEDGALSAMHAAGMTSKILGHSIFERDGQVLHFFRGRAQKGVAVRCVVVVSEDGVSAPKIVSRGAKRHMIGKKRRRRSKS